MPSREHIRKAVNQQLKNNKEYRKYACEAVDILLGNNTSITINLEGAKKIKVPFIDIYCQAFRDDLVSFEDLVLTGFAWQRVYRGELIYRCIQVKESPHGDSEIELNREILLDMVSHYNKRGMYGLKSADFFGGKDGADGYIEFEEPFITDYCGRPLGDDGDPVAHYPEEGINGRSKYFPLEVGYCMPDQMEYHLRMSGCVARFPYDIDVIIFLESKNH